MRERLEVQSRSGVDSLQNDGPVAIHVEVVRGCPIDLDRDADGTGSRQLTNDPAVDTRPEVSLDGSYIVFSPHARAETTSEGSTWTPATRNN